MLFYWKKVMKTYLFNTAPLICENTKYKWVAFPDALSDRRYCITNGDRPAGPGTTLLFGGGADSEFSSTGLLRLTQSASTSSLKSKSPVATDLVQLTGDMS